MMALSLSQPPLLIFFQYKRSDSELKSIHCRAVKMNRSSLECLLQVVEVVLQVIALENPSVDQQNRNTVLVVQLFNLRTTLREMIDESYSSLSPQRQLILQMMYMCASLDFHFRSSQ